MNIIQIVDRMGVWHEMLPELMRKHLVFGHDGRKYLSMVGMQKAFRGFVKEALSESELYDLDHSVDSLADGTVKYFVKFSRESYLIRKMPRMVCPVVSENHLPLLAGDLITGMLKVAHFARKRQLENPEKYAVVTAKWEGGSKTVKLRKPITSLSESIAADWVSMHCKANKLQPPEELEFIYQNPDDDPRKPMILRGESFI